MTDAVVIGSGPNGLVAANLLADAGWSVLVLEAQPTPGGAVRSDTEMADGFVHDTFSAFYPFAAASPVMQHLRLDEHGLEWSHAPAVVGNPLPSGDWALLRRSADATAAGLDALTPGDGDAWLGLCRRWDVVGPDLVAALLGPWPPVRVMSSLVGSLRKSEARGAARDLMGSVRRMGRHRFRGEAARLLLTGNALHADFSPDSAGSGAFGLIFTMLAQQVGFPTPRGGAGQLTAALVRRLESRGGTVATSREVAAVVVRSGRVVGVRLVDGTEVAAKKAVVADVSAPDLYGRLVAREDLPARVRWGLRRFAWDPGTVKVDWALSGPVPWSPAPVTTPATVHVAASVEELATYSAQLRHGLVPSDPFLLVGQMTTADPSRSPKGTESLWAYCHVPQVVRGDAGGDGIRGGWDAADRERMADRIQTRVERFAPGFADLVIARRALGPRDLEARDANLYGGAVNGGTARLRQAAVLRPVPGRGGATTAILGLYLASASAHPGGGVHGAPGANAARAALREG